MDASCCPFPSAQRLESLFGEVFWGFISSPCILISYLLTDIVSSSRNQLSHMRLPLFCRLVRGLPSPSFSPVIFVSRRWRRVRRGSPSSRGPRPLETFAHGPVSSGPIRRCSVCQAWRYFPIFLAMGFRPSGHGKSVTSRGPLRGRWRWRGAGRRDEKWRI